MVLSSRRDFLTRAAAGAGAIGLANLPAMAQSRLRAVPLGQRYITSYYQFTPDALHTLAARALPNGPEYLHIFVQSAPDTAPRPHRTKMVQACGSSFKYGYAFDLNKYPDWKEVSEDQLKAWAVEFRAASLDVSAPADYFAFNEMPDEAPKHPELRRRIARWMQYFYSAGGGPNLRAVFYFTQANLHPATWVGPSDELWEVLDETCDLVVGEHFETGKFAARHSIQQIAELFDIPPRWMMASGDPRRMRIARDKYAVISSTYYGPKDTNWGGLRNDQASPAELKQYLEKMVKATRTSEFGKRRIVFSPLETFHLDPRVNTVLAEVLREDGCGKHRW